MSEIMKIMDGRETQKQKKTKNKTKKKTEKNKEGRSYSERVKAK